MATIVVFGGTGYTGGNIAREAASRGHHVIAVSRTEPAEPIDGVTYETGDVEALAPRLIPGADAVVATLSPRGDTAGRLVGVYRELAPTVRRRRREVRADRRVQLAAAGPRCTSVRRG